MNRLFSAKPLLAAAVALGAVGAASSAHAGSDIAFSIGFATPGYVQPAPVYVQPQPVYVAPPVTYYGGYQRFDRYDRYDDWRWRQHRRHEHRGWDSDRDGVPNRWDRAPMNPYRR